MVFNLSEVILKIKIWPDPIATVTFNLNGISSKSLKTSSQIFERSFVSVYHKLQDVWF